MNGFGSSPGQQGPGHDALPPPGRCETGDGRENTPTTKESTMLRPKRMGPDARQRTVGALLPEFSPELLVGHLTGVSPLFHELESAS